MKENQHEQHVGDILCSFRQTIRIMRLSVFFMVVSTAIAWSATTYSQSTKLSVNLKDATVQEVIKTIEEQSEFLFLYQEGQVDLNRRISIRAEGKQLQEILDEVFKGTGNIYIVSDRQVVIGKAPRKTLEAQLAVLQKDLKTVIEQPQQREIKGKVTDNAGDPLPGATVMIKGTTIGTVTDADGNFSLRIPSNAQTLQISFVGMKTQEVSIDNRTTFNVTLEEESVALEEVVAVGYGIQKKESIVGSIVHATGEDLQRTGHVTDFKQALTGQLPGVVTLTSSGEPGGVMTGESATNIFIRGRNTWNGGQPLILVDGIERDINNIDPNEVESVSVLKDASATAVFGVKGANGVILITTKRGKTGKSNLNFHYTLTGLMVSKQPEILDSYAALMAKNEIIEREGILVPGSWNDYLPYDIVLRYKKPQTDEYAMIYPNVNWEDALYKDISFSQHRASLSVQGGRGAIQYFGLFGYVHEGDAFKDYGGNDKGYDPDFNFNRFNFRSNVDVNLTKTTKLGVDLAGYFSTKNTNWSGEGSSGGPNLFYLRAAYSFPPDLFLPRYDDGRWGMFLEGGGTLVNPVSSVYNAGIRTTRTTQLNANFKLNQDLNFVIKGLNASLSLFYDNSVRSQGGIIDHTTDSDVPGKTTTNTAFEQIYPLLYEGPDQDPSEYTLLHPITVSDEYDWFVKPWYIIEENVTQANWATYIPVTRRLSYEFKLNYDRTFDDVHHVGAMGVFKREEYAQGSMFKNYREDWIFRTTYDYRSKYLIEVNGAYNGSEQFGLGHRFGFFPSLATGWYISNENFFKVDWIDRLKLRYSFGQVGDDKVSGSRWLYTTQYVYGGAVRYVLPTGGMPSSPYTFYRESSLGNPDIHWEKATKNNFGLELGVFNNLASLNFDYFTENRTDILIGGYERTNLPYFGIALPSANLGRVKSKGFEIELNLNKNINANLNIWAKLAITHNENKIVFRDDPPLRDDHLNAKGYPIGQMRSILKTDIYNNWDEVYASIPTETNDLQKLPGYYDLVDFNADGIIKGKDDTAPVGYTGIPQNTGSSTIGVNFKKFSFMVQFYGVNNANRHIPFNNFAGYYDILYGHVKNYWSKDNPGGSFLPRWKSQGENIGDYFLYDASFIRLKTAEISYSLNDMVRVKKAGFTNLRLFLNGNNLFFWSDLPDDRENTNVFGGETQGAYPTMKRINLGIDLTF